MVRLAISVEGQTEEIFMKKVIVPYLREFEIYATPFLLGQTGGDVYLPRVKKDLNELARSFDKVTTFYDFYGFRGKDKEDTKLSLEQKIIDCIAVPLQQKIIPYIQMYEFEGILFASPDAIENNILQKDLSDWAQKILSQFDDNPEKINDSPQTAPSKRLEKSSSYIKTVHGPNIAKEIGLDVLRKKCVGFGNWLNTLETLSRYE
ncbi:MAG: DUF4276 family protein [Methylococcaceae bacterium]|nr:DUF4276 family protein [Methylococcaceae bacterium]